MSATFLLRNFAAVGVYFDTTTQPEQKSRGQTRPLYGGRDARRYMAAIYRDDCI